MPPIVALLLWLILLLALFWLDPAKVPGTSTALWVAVIWISIVGSKLPSQWLEFRAGATALEEGNPLDRSIDLFLILLAIVILTSRRFNWVDFFSRNLALTAFVSFGLISVLWSDFPFVAFKRWFRDLENYFVILVVLSDPQPLEAVRSVLRRVAYLLISLSVVLVKYYPGIAKQYDAWTGTASFVGATTSKNMLGALCLVSGLFFFWDTITRWKERKEKRARRILIVNYAFMGMTLWLLKLSNSATSRVCLVMGCLIILAARSKMFQRHPLLLKALIPSSFIAYLILAFGFDLMGTFASQVGRDPTLTDRTLIWKTVLSLKTNPLVGTGYDSFWLGSRLQYVWGVLRGINEAHNGYLEIYLNLGFIGVFLLCALLLSGYRNVSKRLASSTSLGVLTLALWAIVLFYNMTEAAFRDSLMWLALLLACIAVPARAGASVQDAVAVSLGTANGVSRLPLGSVSRRH